MSTWRDHQRRADAKLVARHGDEATYTPNTGDPISLTVLVDKGFEVLDEEGGVAEHMTVIRYRLVDLPSHEIGAVVTIDGPPTDSARPLRTTGLFGLRTH